MDPTFLSGQKKEKSVNAFLSDFLSVLKILSMLTLFVTANVGKIKGFDKAS
jgi:hypothetical protein